MGVLAMILMYFFISELNAYNITKVGLASGSYGDAIIQFDAQGNTHIWVGKKLYRINASDEVNAIEGEFRRNSWRQFRNDFVVSNRGDDFIMDGETLRAVKAGSGKSKKVAERVVEFHVDNNGNLFYVTEEQHFTSTRNYKLDINLIRPDSAATVQILNNTYFRFLFHRSVFIKSDKSGNVYMAMHFPTNNSILVLTNETLQEEQPVAKYINIAKTEKLEEIDDFMIDDENHLWVLSDDDTSVFVMKLINGTWIEILREQVIPGFDFHKSRLLNIQGTIFIVIESIEKELPMRRIMDGHGRLFEEKNFRVNIFYIASNGKAIKITASDTFSGLSTSVQWAADDEGQIYFYNSEKMLTLKPNETQLLPIQIDKFVEFAVVDWKNNVWIGCTSDTGPQLYNLKKGETVPEEIKGGYTQNCNWPVFSMAVNFLTKKVYFTCDDALYSIDNI